MASTGAAGSTEAETAAAMTADIEATHSSPTVESATVATSSTMDTGIIALQSQMTEMSKTLGEQSRTSEQLLKLIAQYRGESRNAKEQSAKEVAELTKRLEEGLKVTSATKVAIPQPIDSFATSPVASCPAPATEPQTSPEKVQLMTTIATLLKSKDGKLYSDKGFTDSQIINWYSRNGYPDLAQVQKEVIDQAKALEATKPYS